MDLLFNNKYRIPSARMENWDYASDAAYFITICTAQKEHFFGKIKDKKMYLSNIGVLADVFWYEIKNHAKNIQLDAFVVMPNHIHGILILENNHQYLLANNPSVETGHALSSDNHLSEINNEKLTIGQQRFRNQGKNTISSIIGSYKSVVTRHAHRLGYDFAWQERFHDNIIRSDEEYINIVKYIASNVANWEDDRFYW